LCQKTHSRQIFYYLNKWAKNQTKCKGHDEFLRTFCQWFDFKNKPEKYNLIFTSSCSLLMSILNLKNLLMRCANKIYDFPLYYDNQTQIIHETQEQREKFKNDEIIRNEELKIKKEQEKINKKIKEEEEKMEKIKIEDSPIIEYILDPKDIDDNIDTDDDIDPEYIMI